MRELNIDKKINHATQLGTYIDNIKGHVDCLKSGDLILKQICYIVSLDSEEFYFDFPYNKYAETFNKDLNTKDKPVKNASENAIMLFTKFQAENTRHPFVYYKYYFEATQTKFYITELKSNIPINNSLNRKTLMDYLPIVHQGSYLDGPNTHNAMVTEAETGQGIYHELVTLYWPITDATSAKNMSIACSLKVKHGYQIKNDFELDQLFYYIQHYFSSPVLTEIINNKRISEILVYQHSFKNLALDDALDTIDVLSEKFSREEKWEWKMARNKITAWRFFSDILFKIEQIESNLPVPPDSNLSNGMSVLLYFYAHELNYFGVDTEITVSDDVTLLRAWPMDKSLYDMAIVIWNILENAWKEAYKNEKSNVVIEVNVINSKLQCKFINRGVMQPKLVQFCRGLGNYPKVDTTGINPLRGLQIIKAKCEKNNWDIDINTNNPGITEFSIIF